MPKYLRYKINIIAALRDAGYSSVRIRKEKLIGEQMLQKIRKGEMPSWNVLETLCRILKCQPGDLIEFVPEEEQEKDKEKP